MTGRIYILYGVPYTDIALKTNKHGGVKTPFFPPVAPSPLTILELLV